MLDQNVDAAIVILDEAARAIADMPLGRIDAATTANVGLIRGGVAGNIVPPECTVSAEARKHAGTLRNGPVLDSMGAMIDHDGSSTW